MNEQEMRRLVSGASKLISQLRKDRTDTRYEDRVHRALVALKVASEANYAAAQSLHFLKLRDAHAESPTLLNGIQSVGEAIISMEKVLLKCSLDSEGLSKSLSISTLVNPGTRKGRPTPKYLDETFILMRHYERVTGKEVLFPKRLSKSRGEETTQDSTEFLRRCLKQLDPSISTAKAVSLIRYARKQELAPTALLKKILGRKK